MGPFNKISFLNSPCSYFIKHTTKQQTSRQTKPKQNENLTIVRNILLERFSTLYNEKNLRHFHQLKDICHTSIEIRQNLTHTSFQVLTKTSTRFKTFSPESRRTQASISLECRSRLTSCVILAVGTLITSVLKEKKIK